MASISHPSKAKPKTAEPRAWQRMLSGRRLNLLDPSPLDIEIEDIAHGLARVARWNGQTKGPLPFNVAQHSVIVEQLCTQLQPNWPVKWQLAALLHDAPEFVIGDMISPFKAALGTTYKEIEIGLQRAIHMRFSIPADLPSTVEKLIKRADRASAYYEATQFAGFEIEEAARLFAPPGKFGHLSLEILNAEASENAYLKRFHELISLL